MPVGCVPYLPLVEGRKGSGLHPARAPSLRTEEKTSPLAYLAEDAEYIYAQGEGFSYAFSKQYGTFVSLKVEGEEQITSPMRLSAWRAPTDNDSQDPHFLGSGNHLAGRELRRGLYQGV